MTTTIQFDTNGPIPIFPGTVGVIDRSTRGVSGDQPVVPDVSNVTIPNNAIIESIVFRRITDPALAFAGQTFLTAGAVIKVGINTAGLETKYMPSVVVATDDLNTVDYIEIKPDPFFLQATDTLPAPPTNEVVLTAGFIDITEGSVSVMIKYRVASNNTRSSARGNFTTIL